MKYKIIQTLLNLIKVKSIATFVALFVFAFLSLNDKLEMATVVAILMMVFQNLFGKDKNNYDKKL